MISSGEKQKNKARGVSQVKRNQLIFYCALIVLPLIQYCIFYIGVNANSILLAFKEYDGDTGKYSFIGFNNFKAAFTELTQLSELRYAFGNSLLVYAITLVFGITLSVLFSYYIFKKFPGYKVFKVLLFMPSIISSMVMTIIFHQFTERALPLVLEKITGTKPMGLLANLNTMKPTLIAYSIYISFGAGILMYVGAMSNINESVLESARLDGVNTFQELWHMIIPMIFPTLSTFIVVGFAGIFTNQLNLFSFFADKAEARVYTYGYYLYMRTQRGTAAIYPRLSAMGLMFTAIVAPITLILRKLLERFGPSAD